MVMSLSLPGELAAEKRHPRKLSGLTEPQFLAAVFDDPFEMLAAATIFSACPGYKERGRRVPLDHAFLRSRWYQRICDALELDPDQWRRILRENHTRNGNGNE